MGVLVCSVRPQPGLYTLWRFQRVGVSAVPDEILESLHRISAQPGLRRSVRVLRSTLSQVPVAASVVRPVILLPVALLRAGRAADDAAVKKSLDRLQQARPEFTYSVALHTVALCAADSTKHREAIKRNVAWLAEPQTVAGEARGGWSYGPQRTQRSDGSNTRFAVCALSEAARVGVPAPEATWRTAADYWLRSQNDDGSWSYLSHSGASTVTMTLAGIASLFPPTHHR